MFACIYISDFSVEALVRSEPLLRERAVAVLEGKPPLTRVVALNEKARCLGMEAGMTKLQASAFVAQGYVPQSGTTNKDMALLRQRSYEQESAAHAAVLDISHAFSPCVEDAAADTLLLDLAGLERLYGAPAKMGAELKSRVSAVGLEANVALAANPDTALHAARGFDAVTVIAAGRETQRLAALPVHILMDALEITSPPIATGKAPDRERQKIREQMLDTLERWGVRDFRSLALLPERALASRLGQVGAQLRRLARGECSRMLHLCAPAARFEEAIELESPVDAVESLSFLLNRLLEQLCARLEARALSAQSIRMRLQLQRHISEEETRTQEELNRSTGESHNVAGKPIYQRVLRLPVAMRDGKIFLKLLQLDLSAHPPGAPIIKIWLEAEPAPPRSAQRGLFLPVMPEPEKLEITLARINAIAGERRAGIARLLDSHRNDSFQTERFASLTGGTGRTTSTTLWDVAESRLALRMIRPACRLRVDVCEGRPAFLVAQNQKSCHMEGRVNWSSGPWHSSGDWWTENKDGQSGPWDREEWDIALEPAKAAEEQNPTLYRIYRDVGADEWFADASYD